MIHQHGLRRPILASMEVMALENYLELEVDRIRAVIFDFHGVIYYRSKPSRREFFEHVAQEFGTPRETLMRMVPDVLIGKMKPHEIIRLMRSRLNSRGAKISVDDIPSRSRLVLIEETVALVRSLGDNYKIGMIANSDGTAEQRLETLGLNRFFDCVVDSELVGFRKPEAEIYNLAAAGLGCKAAECVFIDNRADNVQGARAVGMSGILYSRDADAGLARQLRRLGVSVGKITTETQAGLAS